MEKLLEIKNLTKSYRQGTTVSTVVNNVSIGVGKGEFVVIMGTSGSGKTSLLHLIAGIDQFDKGTIMYTLPGAVRPPEQRSDHGTPSGHKHTDFGQMNEKAKTMFRRMNIGIVFQQQCLIPDLTVYENILLPMMLETPPLLCGSQRKDAIFGLCSCFGLKEHINKYPSQLSGGQQQRAAILRSVVNRPPLLLCDEPTGSLNRAQTKLVMDLLNELNQDGQTIILVTHDRSVAARGERVVYIEDGKIAGELQFSKTKPDGAGQDRYGVREQELTHFLQKRGW